MSRLLVSHRQMPSAIGGDSGHSGSHALFTSVSGDGGGSLAPVAGLPAVTGSLPMLVPLCLSAAPGQRMQKSRIAPDALHSGPVLLRSGHGLHPASTAREHHTSPRGTAERGKACRGGPSILLADLCDRSHCLTCGSVFAAARGRDRWQSRRFPAAALRPAPRTALDGCSESALSTRKDADRDPWARCPRRWRPFVHGTGRLSVFSKSRWDGWRWR